MDVTGEIYRAYYISSDLGGYSVFMAGKRAEFLTIGDARAHIDRYYDQLGKPAYSSKEGDGHLMPPPGAKPGVFATLELTRDDIVTFTEAFRRAMNSLDNEASADSNMADDLIIIDAMGNRQRADAYRKRAKDKSDLCEKMRVWLHQLEPEK